MKLSKKQQADLETCIYFIPSQLERWPRTERGIEMFFENSEKGLHNELLNVSMFKSENPDEKTLFVLSQGKSWRGIHIGMYEEGVLAGDMPYFVLLGGYYGDEPMPRAVVDFLKKEMFRGIDSEIIETCYWLVLESKK